MNQELIKRMADRIINGHDTAWGMNIEHCDWGPGVGLYGIYIAFEVTKDEKYLRYIVGWIERFETDIASIKTINECAPLLTVLHVYTVNGNKALLNLCRQVADNMIEKAARTKIGGFEHTVTEDISALKEQMWADTLFMIGIFLAKLFHITGENRYLQEAVNQLKLHLQVLDDKQTGLFFHGYNCNTLDNMSSALWGRANAWITISTVEILKYLPNEFDTHNEIITRLQRQITSYSAFIRKDGMFGTVLDMPEECLEVSASCGIAYGIKRAALAGIVEETLCSITKKVSEALPQYINDLGEVECVSTGTPVMETRDSYNKIPYEKTLYGQTLAILLLSLE